MSQGQILLLVLIGIVIVVAVAIWLTMRRRHTDRLRADFGDEYDRTLEARGDRAAAEADLVERRKRVAALDIRPLKRSERADFMREWQEVKGVFVDSPVEAVLHANRLLKSMMNARGFPMADFDHRYEDLTVDHGAVARHYRAGHDIVERQNAGQASTEDLRQAMKHFEQLFDDLVSDVDDADDGPAERRVIDHRPRSDRVEAGIAR